MQKGKVRGVAAVILLSIITCGIYYLFWIYKTSKETSIALGEAPKAGLELLFCLITCSIYQWYWYWKTSKKIAQVQQNAGCPVNDLSLVTLILAILGVGSVINMGLLQNEVNKAWNAPGNNGGNPQV